MSVDIILLPVEIMLRISVFTLFCLCGVQVTDLTLARENQTNFEEYLRNNTNVNPGIDLTVTVLTTGFWPSYKSFDLSLPPEMVTFTLSLESGHVKVSPLMSVLQ